MKFTEINAIYSRKIADLMAEGYTINSNTMGGSQGDIAAIDLRKGNDILRVRLHKEMSHTYTDEHFWGDCIVLTVGRCTDEWVINATGSECYATIWNNKLEIIEERIFWQMDGRNTNWYIEGEDGKAALLKRNSRYSNRKVSYDERDFPGMEKTMLPAIRRHTGKKSLPISKIRRIYKKSTGEDKYIYCAELVNRVSVVFA